MFLNIFILRRPGVDNLADISKILTMFIKNAFQDWKKCTKMQSIYVFSDIAKFADFQWKSADVSITQGMCHMIHIFLGSFLGKV